MRNHPDTLKFPRRPQPADSAAPPVAATAARHRLQRWHAYRDLACFESLDRWQSPLTASPRDARRQDTPARKRR